MQSRSHLGKVYHKSGELSVPYQVSIWTIIDSPFSTEKGAHNEVFKAMRLEQQRNQRLGNDNDNSLTLRSQSEIAEKNNRLVESVEDNDRLLEKVRR